MPHCSYVANVVSKAEYCLRFRDNVYIEVNLRIFVQDKQMFSRAPFGFSSQRADLCALVVHNMGWLIIVQVVRYTGNTNKAYDQLACKSFHTRATITHV